MRAEAGTLSGGRLGGLTTALRSRTTCRSRGGGRRILDRPSVESQQASIDRLRREIAELRASRKRIVLAADAERRALERALHETVHQQLIALAVNMQLAVEAADADPTAAKTLLEAMGGDVKSALDDTAKLAQRMYPPLLDGGGLAAALRT